MSVIALRNAGACGVLRKSMNDNNMTIPKMRKGTILEIVNCLIYSEICEAGSLKNGNGRFIPILISSVVGYVLIRVINVQMALGVNCVPRSKDIASKMV